MDLPLAILLAAATTLIASYIQHNFWRARNLQSIKDREYENAVSLVQEISEAIDKRLYIQSLYTSAVLEDELNDDLHNEYKSALAAWMSRFSYFRSKIEIQFGRKLSLEFEQKLHSKMQLASDAVSLRVRYGDKLSIRDRFLFESSRGKMNSARLECRRYLTKLNSIVTEERYGIRLRINNLNHGEKEYISISYLVSRLFSLNS